MNAISDDTLTIDFGAHVVLNVPDVGEMRVLDDMIGPMHSDPEAIIDFIDQSYLDGMVLSQPPYIGGSDVKTVKESNDALHEVVSKHDQLYSLAALPVGAGGDVAADELERCLDMGFNGAAVETKSHGTKLSDTELTPVFEKANNTGAPILVHPKLHQTVGKTDTHLQDKYRLNAILGREVGLIETICELIHGGTYDSFEDLNLVYHHLGGNIASMLGRIALHFDKGRWPNQEEMKPYDQFRTQLEERVFIDTSGFYGSHTAINAALREFPTDNIFFGSDSPYEPRSVTEMNDFIRSIEHNSSLTGKSKILGENALELLVNT